MRNVCIIGGAAALAGPLIQHYLADPDTLVSVVCRSSLPPDPWPDRLNVYDGIGQVAHIPDILITVPGSTDNAQLSSMTDDQWDRVLESTLTAPYKALRALLSYMNGGNVVVVGSIVGSIGGIGCANYAAAKAGLIGLVRAAANESARTNVCVNLLELGFIDHGMGERLGPVKDKILPNIPLKRFGTVEDFVQAVDYLGRVRYMTGGILTLAGGLR